MNDPQSELKAAIEDIADEERRHEAMHLTADELMTYARGGMPAEEEARAADHLVWCNRCTASLLTVEAFDEVEISDAEVAAAWEKMKASLGRRRAGARAWPRERPHFIQAFGPAHAYGIAASLLIALIAVGAWSITLHRDSRRLAAALGSQSESPDRAAAAGIQTGAGTPSELRRVEGYERQIAELQQQVDTLSEPQTNVVIADLYPADGTRGSGSAVTTIDVPSGANVFAVILNGFADRSHPDYHVDIFDRRGTRIWRGEKLRRTEFGNFTLALPRRLLPAGQYRLRLSGISRGQATLLEEYSILVRYR